MLDKKDSCCEERSDESTLVAAIPNHAKPSVPHKQMAGHQMNYLPYSFSPWIAAMWPAYAAGTSGTGSSRNRATTAFK